MKYPTDIAMDLLHEMGADNGCVFKPCSKHLEELIMAIGKCQTEGVKFTPENIAMLAYGEQSEKEEKFKKYTHFTKLDKALNEIFDGCKNCRIQGRIS